MVEILCGVLSGSNFGKNIRSWTDVFEQDSVDPANLGQCFIAINPAMFSPNYKEDLKSYDSKFKFFWIFYMFFFIFQKQFKKTS